MQKSVKKGFDVIIGNPPYKAGLHLSFLKDALDRANDGGKVLFIHPSDWLVQKRPDYSRKRASYQKLRDHLSSYSTLVEFIDNPFGEDAQMFMPLCITHIQKSPGGPQFVDSRSNFYGASHFKASLHKIHHLNEATRWVDGKTENSIINKICPQESGSWKPQLGKKGNFYISLSRLSGAGSTPVSIDGENYEIPNMFSLGNKFTMTITHLPQIARAQGGKEVGNEKPYVSFSSLDEARSALHFIMQTKLMRVYIALIKIDQHAADALMHLIPWLDWSREWSDANLMEYFGLDEKEKSIVEKIFAMIAQRKS
jgi:hypothetical protein